MTIVRSVDQHRDRRSMRTNRADRLKKARSVSPPPKGLGPCRLAWRLAQGPSDLGAALTCARAVRMRSMMEKHTSKPKVTIKKFTTADLRAAVASARLRPDATQAEFNAAIRKYAAKLGHFDYAEWVPIERRAEAGLNPSKKPGAGRRASRAPKKPGAGRRASAPERKYPRRRDGSPAPTTYYWDNLGLMRWSDTDGLVRPQNFPEHAEWLKYAKPEGDGDECPEC